MEDEFIDWPVKSPEDVVWLMPAVLSRSSFTPAYRDPLPPIGWRGVVKLEGDFDRYVSVIPLNMDGLEFGGQSNKFLLEIVSKHKGASWEDRGINTITYWGTKKQIEYAYYRFFHQHVNFCVTEFVD